ncbi:2-succinyl-6-hydroxy-2,4-cyclohexadiene-1-carboxylate synthase [Fischerella thermalis CCMEE 5268]|uniref:Putative 2-succinyl-6-hydroxy-2,4-cyclohexadiene-1-carboxylate synthase n=1 Tax=Fischerella thermalis CCMEE 5268 TaxID=2019662 RepID=A0A2N6KAN7_9CYAN|nr:2-succinyl-6-hydroxy-2,4-cyclohexadiene-1-carboxylate synthase [Fischerella thermalis]PLZ95434.1 2-succinyl-6-hydroxy-2,4-cyclohexadiene-1-carboxylate synthase [Fischerella thermalis CCMEE 5268]
MTIEKYQLFYAFDGDRNQPVILFLHGFMGNSHEFDEAIQLLNNNFYCLKVDLPGHGNTKVLGSEDYYSMAYTAQGLIDLLDNLKIHQCFLVGYSMGGRLALYLTLYFPQKFPKVVLESASPGLLTFAERQERIKWDQQIARKLERSIEKNDFIVFLRNWYNQPIFGNIKNHPQFQNLIEIRTQNNPIELAKSLRLMGTGCQPSLWEKLKENRNDLLLLAGEYDEKFIDINQQMAKICQYCQLTIVSNAGHNIHFENPNAFVENLKKFLISNQPFTKKSHNQT